MTEPSSGVPGEIADAEVETPTPDQPGTVELDLDEEKLEAWDEVKGDYQVEPGGAAVPNSMDGTDLSADAAATDAADTDAADTEASDTDAADTEASDTDASSDR